MNKDEQVLGIYVAYELCEISARERDRRIEEIRNE